MGRRTPARRAGALVASTSRLRGDVRPMSPGQCSSPWRCWACRLQARTTWDPKVAKMRHRRQRSRAVFIGGGSPLSHVKNRNLEAMRETPQVVVKLLHRRPAFETTRVAHDIARTGAMYTTPSKGRAKWRATSQDSLQIQTGDAHAAASRTCRRTLGGSKHWRSLDLTPDRHRDRWALPPRRGR